MTDTLADSQSGSLSDLSSRAKVSLEWLKNVFLENFSKGEVTTKSLSRLVGKDTEFFEYFFDLLDDDESGSVSFQEFIGGLHRLARGRDIPDKKLTALSQMFLRESGSKWEVTLTEFLLICNGPKFAESLFGLFDIDDSGKIESTEFIMGLDKLARSNSDIKWLSWTEKWFSKNANKDGHITKDQFFTCLNVKQSLFADRLFDVVDTDNSGHVEVTELMGVLHILTQGTPKERLLFLFKIYDIDGNGSLNYEETRTILLWGLVDNCLEEKAEQLVEKLAKVLFRNLDRNQDGKVSMAEFDFFLNKYPQIVENLTISFSKCIRPRSKARFFSGSGVVKKCTRTWSLMKNNKPLIGFWMVYVAINLTLFITAAAKYWHTSNIYVVVARGCGSALNFNPAFIVVLMFRHILTYLRSTMVGKYLPLDHSIAAHKVIGVVIVLYSAVHTSMHVANLESMSRETNGTLALYLFTLEAGLGWLGGSACITGWILILILAIIAITSHPFVRRTGHFQLFYWTHFLFLVWWVVLCLHTRLFWAWLAAPAAIYFTEKLYRHFKNGKTNEIVVRSIRSVDSKVSEVIIERPRGLKFNAGDYIFINIAKIAQFEWHPFTVSSPPEQTDYLSLHVQAVGDWTKRLRALGDSWTGRCSTATSAVSLSSGCYSADTSRNSFDSACYDQEVTPDGKPPNAQGILPSEKGKNSVSLIMMRPIIPIESFIKRKESDVESNCTGPSSKKVGKRDVFKQIKVQIDGPYGSPSTTVYDVDHAILIAAGIGVTPFASILQSIMHRKKRQRAICPECNHCWKLFDNTGLIRVPKKVEFIWVTRTFNALEWFLGVLGELEDEQALFSDDERFLELNLHVTSALSRSDIRATALQMALELCYQEESRDPLCGLRSRIQPGRPNWRKIFANILGGHEKKVCVFYCGPPQLEAILKKFCSEFGLGFRAENF